MRFGFQRAQPVDGILYYPKLPPVETRSFTILIVEDDPNDVMLMRRAIQKAEVTHPIQFVPDGVQAILYLRGAEKYGDRGAYPFPHFVITDLKMPLAGGFEILEWLRDHQDCSVIPVVVFSSSKQDSDIKRAYGLGANAYLVKPPNPQDMTAVMRKLFDFWSMCEKPTLEQNC